MKCFFGTLGLVCCLSASSAYSSAVLLMPQELYSIAMANSCEQVDDYYVDRLGPIAPLYAYGLIDGEQHESAAFWCQRDSNDSKVYVLMFMIRDSELGAQYAGEIIWENYPRGLSVYSGNRDISKLVHLKDGDNLPKDKRLSGKGVMSSYDGVSELFINKNGDWYVKQWH